MPELQYLSALWTTLRADHRELRERAANTAEIDGSERPGGERPNDAGDIVQYVVITAALALAAVAIVAIIVTKITNKANGLQTE